MWKQRFPGKLPGGSFRLRAWGIEVTQIGKTGYAPDHYIDQKMTEKENQLYKNKEPGNNKDEFVPEVFRCPDIY